MVAVKPEGFCKCESKCLLNKPTGMNWLESTGSSQCHSSDNICQHPLRAGLCVPLQSAFRRFNQFLDGKWLSAEIKDKNYLRFLWGPIISERRMQHISDGVQWQYLLWKNAVHRSINMLGGRLNDWSAGTRSRQIWSALTKPCTFKADGTTTVNIIYIIACNIINQVQCVIMESTRGEASSYAAAHVPNYHRIKQSPTVAQARLYLRNHTVDVMVSTRSPVSKDLADKQQPPTTINSST